jgi:rSAM/selenodomain-associated transferase 2
VFSISVIIPVYRDADALARTLASTDLSGAEVIVSAPHDDDSLHALRLARPDLRWVDAPRGSARQMNGGADVVHGEWIVFLHADTRLPQEWRRAIATAHESGAGYAVGCFRFALDSPSLFARLIEAGVHLRVWLFRLPYGDQALFMRRRLFDDLGGYADLPIMEDVDLVRRARRCGRLFRSRLCATTSARRWERDGWIRRTVRHLALIALYFCGVRPERLVRLDPARRAHQDPHGGRISL